MRFVAIGAVVSRAYITYKSGEWPRGTLDPSLEQRIAELEVIYDAAPIGLFLCDRECRFIRVNRHLAIEIDGLPIEAHLGKVAWDVVPDLRRTVEPMFRHVLDTGEPVHRFQVEGETPKAPGIKRYWEASYHPVYNVDDEIIAISGIVDEISDRRAADDERAKSQARVQRLLEANLFGVATVTLAGITEANDAYLAILGYSREDYLRHGVDWKAITPPEYRENDLAAIRALKDTGICRVFEKEYIRKNGTRVPVLIGATLLDREPMRWLSFVIDISERKAREEHARQLVEELAHRTKNLLSVIQAIAHQLGQKSDSIDEFQQRFSSRLQALAGIHDLMVREDWRGAPIRELIMSQFAHCADLVGDRIVLDGSPLSLTATACQYLGIALFELCTNALKYGALSAATGTVTIRWSLEPASHPDHFRLEWMEKGGPPVKEPEHRGFGYKVTTDIIARSLDGTVSEEFQKDGLRWCVSLPVSVLLEPVLDHNTEPRSPA
jgi:PAS domain S-box-containing protein